MNKRLNVLWPVNVVKNKRKNILSPVCYCNVLGVRTQIVISNSSLRERRGYTKFYYITDLFSVDMAIYDSIVSFQKIDAY